MSKFKSGSQRKFLYAMDKDKAQGQNPLDVKQQKSSPMSLPTSHPAEMTTPPAAYALGTISAPKFHPPVGKSIKPTSNPSLGLPKPASDKPMTIKPLPGLPRFGRVRKFLK